MGNSVGYGLSTLWDMMGDITSSMRGDTMDAGKTWKNDISIDNNMSNNISYQFE